VYRNLRTAGRISMKFDFKIFFFVGKASPLCYNTLTNKKEHCNIVIYIYIYIPSLINNQPEDGFLKKLKPVADNYLN